MNLDFHYYATYLAAHYAGFTEQEAKTIAYAAQFVDDCIATERPTHAPNRVTCMSVKELKNMDIKTTWNRNDYQNFYEIWQCFHFLPGNEFYSCRYEGKTHNSKWIFSESDNELFRNLCLPKSVLVMNMIEDLKNYTQARNFLHMVGIRMHVLADTWSHQYFLGMPRWFSNEVESNTVKVKSNNIFSPVSYYSWRFWKNDNLEKLEFSNTPTLPSYESISYLGHGRLGTIADYGCLTFQYQPNWKASGDLITRNNVDIFTNAFHQMVYAMECVIQNKPFDPENIPLNHKEEINSVLKTQMLDQSLAWNNLIKQVCGKALEAYNSKTWRNEYKTESGGNYVQFIQAADQHVSFITKNINSARFAHKNSSTGEIRYSSLINYLDWEYHPYSMICMDGHMYIRSVENSYPTGKLQKVDTVSYLEHNYHDCWNCNIDLSNNLFHHYYSNNNSLDHTDIICNYCGWDDSKWTAKLIEPKYLI